MRSGGNEEDVGVTRRNGVRATRKLTGGMIGLGGGVVHLSWLVLSLRKLDRMFSTQCRLWCCGCFTESTVPDEKGRKVCKSARSACANLFHRAWIYGNEGNEILMRELISYSYFFVIANYTTTTNYY